MGRIAVDPAAVARAPRNVRRVTEGDEARMIDAGLYHAVTSEYRRRPGRKPDEQLQGLDAELGSSFGVKRTVFGRISTGFI
jgi:hypothetical protein